MTVITLARQVGSGGHAVAQALSERLGLRVIGRKELQEEALKRGLTLPESFVQFASEDGNGGPQHYLTYSELEFDLALRGGPYLAAGDVATGFLTDITAQRREILLTLQVLIYELAAQDNVLLVGAGAQILLAELPQVLRVKIIAPVETRIQRMETAYSLTNEEARAAVTAGDQEQVDYNRVIFEEDWHNPELWDLVVNSEKFAIDDIVELLRPASKSRAKIDAVVSHLLLAAEIDKAMLRSPELADVLVWGTPTSDGVVIHGDVSSEEALFEISKLISKHAAAESLTYDVSVRSLL